MNNCQPYDNQGQLVPVAPPNYLLGVVMPDGATHQLKLYGQVDTYSNYMYYYNPQTGLDACTGATLPSPLVYYTDDGSYIRVVVNTTQSANPTWTMYLPNGIAVSGGTWMIYQNGGGAAPFTYPSSITDRNGNTVSISQGLDSSRRQTVTLQDSQGRSILITEGVGITQTGANGSTLAWTFGTGTGGVYGPTCTTPGWQGCGAYQGGGMATLTLPSPTGPTLQYSFGYDPQGLLSSVTKPSGSSVNYTYTAGPPTTVGITTLFNTFAVATKTVNWKDTSDGRTTARTEPWSYNYSYNDAQGSGPCGGNCTQITRPDGGVEVTYYEANDATSLAGTRMMPTRVIEPDGSRVEYQYEENPAFFESSGNPFVAVTAKIAAASGSPTIAAIETRTIDQNGNTIDTRDYDWVPYSKLQHDSYGNLSGFTAGTLLREAARSMLVQTPAATNGNGPPDSPSGYWNPAAPRVRNLPLRTAVTGAGTGALTEWSYDGNGNELTEAKWDSTLVSAMPGPLNSASPLLNAANASITTRTYDTHGDVVSQADARNNTVETTNWSNWPFSISRSTQLQSFSIQFDSATGLTLSSLDSNNQTQSAYSWDSIGRMVLKTDNASGNAVRNTQVTYDDMNLRVITSKDQNALGDGAIVSAVDYDQLYRVSATRQMETAGQNADDPTTGIKVQTRYYFGSSGNFTAVSNPFRASTSTAASTEPTMGWSVSSRDKNGRVTRVNTYTGSALPAPWGSAAASSSTTTTYSGSSTTVTDPAGHKRVSVVDGLGRLVQVTEYPASSAVQTTYAYDALGDLTSVSQSGLTRTFVYDSLQRLQSATNPESGKTVYSYL